MSNPNPRAFNRHDSDLGTAKPGDLVPAWWDTEDGRPAGDHLATVLEVRPYSGKFSNRFSIVAKLTAPGTKRGWVEMPL